MLIAFPGTRARRTAPLTSDKQGGIKTRSTPASLSFKGQASKHTTLKWSVEDTDKSDKKAKSQSNVSFNLRAKPGEAKETKTDLKPLQSRVENQQSVLECNFNFNSI